MIDTREHPRKKKPKVGDQKMIGGVIHERQFRRSPEGYLIVSGSRYLYEWVPVKDKPQP